MYRNIADVLNAWEKESLATQRIMDSLTDASLSQQIAEGHRTLGRVGWHIVTTIPEMMARTGLSVMSVSPEAAVPQKASAIQQAYAAAAGELLEQIRNHWTDQTLMMADDMYGESWPRGLTIRILMDHQSHHRGQMTVLMRQAGLKVPGICGPALEEWTTFGSKPPEI